MFLANVGDRLDDLALVQARLKRHQKRLLVQSIIEKSKLSQLSRDAKVYASAQNAYLPINFVTLSSSSKRYDAPMRIALRMASRARM